MQHQASTVASGPHGRRSCRACIEKYNTRHAKNGSMPPQPAPESPQAADSADAPPTTTDSDGTAQQAADFDGTAQQAADFDGNALQAAGSAGTGMCMDQDSQLPQSIMLTQAPRAAWLGAGGEGEADWGTPAAAAAAASRRRARAQLCEGLGLQPDAAPGARLDRPLRTLQDIEDDLRRLLGAASLDSRAQQGLGAGAPQVALSEHTTASLGHMEGMEGILDSWASTLGDADRAAARSAGNYGDYSTSPYEASLPSQMSAASCHWPGYGGGGGRAGAAPPAFEQRTVYATLTMASHAGLRRRRARCAARLRMAGGHGGGCGLCWWSPQRLGTAAREPLAG